MTDSGVPASPDAPTDYGLSPQLRARLMGTVLVAIGAVLVLMTVLVMVLGLSKDILSGVIILAVIGVFTLGFLLVRRWYVVRLDAVGYQVRFIRGAGTKAARWSDVEDLQTTTVANAPCVILRLRDGRTTTVPVELLAGDREVFVKDLQGHLDRGHGYRRLG